MAQAAVNVYMGGKNYLGTLDDASSHCRHQESFAKNSILFEFI